MIRLLKYSKILNLNSLLTTVLKTIQTFAVDRRYNRVLWSHHICWKTPTCQIYEGIHKWHTQNHINEKYSRSIKKSVILRKRHLLFWNAFWNFCSPFSMRSRSSNWALAIIFSLGSNNANGFIFQTLLKVR